VLLEGSAAVQPGERVRYVLHRHRSVLVHLHPFERRGQRVLSRGSAPGRPLWNVVLHPSLPAAVLVPFCCPSLLTAAGIRFFSFVVPLFGRLRRTMGPGVAAASVLASSTSDNCTRSPPRRSPMCPLPPHEPASGVVTESHCDGSRTFDLATLRRSRTGRGRDTPVPSAARHRSCAEHRLFALDLYT